MFSWMQKAKDSLASNSSRPDECDAFSKLREGEGQVTAGDYGMWFTSAGDDAFSRSDTFKAIDRIYRAVAGREEIALAEIFSHLGAGCGDPRRIPLPDSPLVVPVLAGDNQCLLVSASKEKGIRFHFPRSVPPAFRVEMLNSAAAFLEAGRKSSLVPRSELPQDDTDERSSARWWTAMKRTITDQEARGELSQAVGKVTYK